MAPKSLVDGLFILPGMVNLYLLDAPEGLTLIDTGFPGYEKKVLAALKALGRPAASLKHIVLTHAHADHIGGLAALKRATGARTYMHGTDIPVARQGGPFRPMKASPGLMAHALLAVLTRLHKKVAPAAIDEPLTDGDVLPIADGLRVIHVPGHCAGQVALMWEERGMLFAADACGNIPKLGPPIGYEDRAEGEASQRKLAALTFEAACFGHGKPILKGASSRFRETFARP